MASFYMKMSSSNKESLLLIIYDIHIFYKLCHLNGICSLSCNLLLCLRYFKEFLIHQQTAKTICMY